MIAQRQGPHIHDTSVESVIFFDISWEPMSSSQLGAFETVTEAKDVRFTDNVLEKFESVFFWKYKMSIKPPNLELQVSLSSVDYLGRSDKMKGYSHFSPSRQESGHY
jgi:hypothetical protein